MSEQNRDNPTGPRSDADQPADEPQAEQPEAASPGDASGDASGGASGGAEDAAEQVEQDIRQTLNAVQEERDELEQRLMRIAADYQNYARRAEQNTKTAAEQQLMDMGKALVTVLDHFDRALQVDPEKTTVKSLLDGVEMVHGELLRTLQRFGIERLDVEPGEAFDPNRHEALMRQPHDEYETDHVIQQLQPGYRINDKTIRPAQVSVAE